MIANDVLARLRAAADAYAKSGPPPSPPARPMREREPGVREFVLPPCEYRGQAIAEATRRIPCCGNQVRLEELFPCAAPENSAHEAFSIQCLDCALDKTQSPLWPRCLHRQLEGPAPSGPASGSPFRCSRPPARPVALLDCLICAGLRPGDSSEPSGEMA